VGWSDAQWNRVREEVLRGWQSARVAGSFLPTYGPLPPSIQVVQSERIRDDGTVDDAETLRIFQLSVRVPLSRQQVHEDDLSDALLAFRRAATALALAEDEAIFNGQDPFTPTSTRLRATMATATRGQFTQRGRFPRVEFDDGEPYQEGIRDVRLALSTAIQFRMPFAANPSALGLVDGAAGDEVSRQLTGDGLVTAIAFAVSRLESNGYGPPFMCVLRSTTYAAAYSPLPLTLVLPADRMEPLLGRALARSSALDQQPLRLPTLPTVCGVVLSLAGDAVDLAVAADATVEFTQVTNQGRYEFLVFERFALRIKDNNAILRLQEQNLPAGVARAPTLVHRVEA
jgi:uncharacterized linocin/CFP29 family protein